MTGEPTMMNPKEMLRDEPTIDLIAQPEESLDVPEDSEGTKPTSSMLDHPSELQIAQRRVVMFANLWKTERQVSNQLEATLNKVKEERDELKGRISTSMEILNTSKEDSNNKRKRKITENKIGQMGVCGRCDKGHTGKCLQVKGIGGRNCGICGRNHRGECFFRNINCFTCGQIGHYASQCPQFNNYGCYYCGATDHLATTCPKKRSECLKKT